MEIKASCKRRVCDHRITQIRNHEPEDCLYRNILPLETKSTFAPAWHLSILISRTYPRYIPYNFSLTINPSSLRTFNTLSNQSHARCPILPYRRFAATWEDRLTTFFHLVSIWRGATADNIIIVRPTCYIDFSGLVLLNQSCFMPCY